MSPKLRLGDMIIMICTDSAYMCTSHYHSNSEMKNGRIIRQKHWLLIIYKITFFITSILKYLLKNYHTLLSFCLVNPNMFY
jgi:hypothetical protein